VSSPCGEIDLIPTERYTQADATKARDEAQVVVAIAGRAPCFEAARRGRVNGRRAR
jgi:hypothetical protein